MADIIPKGKSGTLLVIHARTMAAVVNSAFAVIDAEEGEQPQG